MNAPLGSTDHQAGEYDQALMELSTILAHRIRSLVAGIEGFTDLLTETLADRDQREMALRILEATHRIERVLKDLQTFSRPIDLMTIPLGIDEVLLDLFDALDATDRDRLELQFNPRANATIDVDPRLFRQALLCIVQNALEATPDRSGVKMVVQVDEDHQTVAFDIRNPGSIGISDAEKQVFIPFFTTKAQNLGVGLPLARRIVEAHTGTLNLVENAPQTGICFRLAIPSASED